MFSSNVKHCSCMRAIIRTDHKIIWPLGQKKRKKVSGFWSPRHIASEPHVSVFNFLLFCYETMSNYNQNCWIDLNSAVLCFKRLFHVGVWMFVRFVGPLLATIPCVWKIRSGSNNRIHCICITYFTCWQKKDYPKKKKKKKKITKEKRKKVHHRTNFEATCTCSLWPETGLFIFWPKRFLQSVRERHWWLNTKFSYSQIIFVHHD